MIPTLATTRLQLRPLSLADAPAIQQIFPQWAIVQWLDASVPWPYPANGAHYFLEHVALPAMASGSAWHWGIYRLADPQQLIGVITLQDVADHNRGFWIDPAWQGCGYASEAADAVTAFWFDELNKSVLRVPKPAANIASRRISERQGMRVINCFEGNLVSGRCLLELWELTREEWHIHIKQR